MPPPHRLLPSSSSSSSAAARPRARHSLSHDCVSVCILIYVHGFLKALLVPLHECLCSSLAPETASPSQSSSAAKGKDPSKKKKGSGKSEYGGSRD